MNKIIQIQKSAKKPIVDNNDSINLLKRTMRIPVDIATTDTPKVKTGRPMIRTIVRPANKPMRVRVRFRPKQGTLVSENQVHNFFAASKRYSLICQIGKGGMSKVFKARDSFLNYDVALKFLPKELTNDNAAIEAFRNEARTVMQLSHKNIIKLHNMEIGAGTMFLVMEYIEGRDFSEIMTQMGRLKIESVLQIMHSCAAGIGYAHSCGVLHKDLKPANLMLSTDSVLKIVDFGIARHMAEDEVDGQHLFLEGTYPYMSPEQYEGGKLDCRTDIYSLAAVIYEFLAGKPILPFAGNHEDILTASIEPIEGVSDKVWNVISKALSSNRDARWSSVGEFYTAFEEAVSSAFG